MACYHSERSPVKLTYRLNDHSVHLVGTELELVARETGERTKDSGSVTWSVTWQSYQSVMITWSVTWHIIIDQSHYIIICNYMIKNINHINSQSWNDHMIVTWWSHAHLWDSPRAITFISDCGRPEHNMYISASHNYTSVQKTAVDNILFTIACVNNDVSRQMQKRNNTTTPRTFFFLKEVQ